MAGHEPLRHQNADEYPLSEFVDTHEKHVHLSGDGSIHVDQLMCAWCRVETRLEAQTRCGKQSIVVRVDHMPECTFWHKVGDGDEWCECDLCLAPCVHLAGEGACEDCLLERCGLIPVGAR